MKWSSYSRDKGYGFFLVPGILLFLVFIIFPFAMNLAVSFTKWSGVGIPKFIGAENYIKAIGDATFWASFQNNLLLIFSMTIVPGIIGLILSVVLYDYVAKRIGEKTANFFRAGFYLPQIIPVVVAGVVWKWILQPNWGALNWLLTSIGLEGLARNWLGESSTALPSVMAVLVWFQIGYPLVIFIAALQRIDPEIYESAAIDGASWWRVFCNITIPQIRPEVSVVILTTVIHSLKIFGPIYAMTKGGPGTDTIVASYFSYKNFFEKSNVGYGATMSTILSLIIILLTVVYISIQTNQELKEN